MMSYQYYGANKWAGLSLMNGGTEKAFFGKGGGGNWHTLAAGGDGTTYWSAFDLLPFHSRAATPATSIWSSASTTSRASCCAPRRGRSSAATFPEDEPSSVGCQRHAGHGHRRHHRIRLNVGSSDGGATIGKVFFDEIRYGTNWSDLLAVTCPTGPAATR
jgi:hypothetical protein